MMKFHKLELDGPQLVEPGLYRDDRGYFLETWREEEFLIDGRPVRFVQDNFSSSRRGVVRGLHFQVAPAAQQKLVSVLYGEILDVAVDLRKGSPTFGKHLSVRLDSRDHRMLWIPEGFAHGFAVLSEEAGVAYKCSDYYDPARERGILWNDPELGIDWEVEIPVLSEKDRGQPLLSGLAREDLFI